MRPRTLVVLLLLVVGLGLFIALYERKLPSSTERAERAKKVVPVGKDEVTGVTLETPAGVLELVRAEPAPAATPAKGKKGEDEEKGEEAEAAPAVADWSLAKPLRAHADSFAVERLVESLTGLEKSRTLEGVERKAVGLDHPRATVRVRTKKGETVLLLGADVPTGGSLIAGIEGEEGAFVVPSTVLSEVEKPADDWRDKQLFRGGREAIQRLTLRFGEAPPVVLVQGPKGFEMEGPLRDRADRDAVEALVADLTGLSAERFVNGRAPAELGLAPARGTLEVVVRGGAPLRIAIGADIVEAGAVPPAGTGEGGSGGAKLAYLQVGDAVVEARTGLAAELARTAEAWRSRSLSGFEVHQIESAAVAEAGGAPLQLTRAGTDWKRGSTTISYLPVSDLLFALSSARAERLLGAAEAPQAGAAPALTFKLRSKEAGEETVLLYPPTPQGVPARVSDRQPLLLLPAPTLQQLRAKLAEVRSAKPVPPEPAAKPGD